VQVAECHLHIAAIAALGMIGVVSPGAWHFRLVQCNGSNRRRQCRIKEGARGAAAPGPTVLGPAIGGSG